MPEKSTKERSVTASCGGVCRVEETGTCYIAVEARNKLNAPAYKHGPYQYNENTSKAYIGRLKGIFPLCQRQDDSRGAINSLIDRHNLDFPKFPIDKLK